MMCSSQDAGLLGGMITVNNLTKAYGSTTAVKNLSFSVPDGKVTGFLGPNGSGKSSTMRCMLGLDRVNSGNVTFGGVYRDGRAYNNVFQKLDHKASVAGAVLDATWFTPQRSGRNHLRVLAQGAGLPASRVDEVLEMVGLTSAAKKRVGGYSLGMKQRLGLAGALLGDPQHIILDEPVNGLDPEGVSWIRQVIREQAAAGKAVLVSSHLLSEMERTADRLVVIGKGELIGEYTMDDFLGTGTYISVESPSVQELAGVLRAQGLNVTEPAMKDVIHVTPGDRSEEIVRLAIANAALSNGLLITEMHTVKKNLEQQFLAATAQAQEYVTKKAK